MKEITKLFQIVCKHKEIDCAPSPRTRECFNSIIDDDDEFFSEGDGEPIGLGKVLDLVCEGKEIEFEDYICEMKEVKVVLRDGELVVEDAVYD